jgi:hypothetical protein
MIRVEAYLRSLPHGFESFPEYRAKASVVRAGLRILPVPDDALPRLPDPLRRLIQAPPPVSSWVSEVEYCALSLALADLHGWSDEDFGRYWYDVTVALVQSRLYNALLGMLTPKVILRSAAWRWSAFHRGITVYTRPVPEGLHVELTAPEGLLPAVCISAYTQVFQATMDGAASDAKATLLRAEKGGGLYLVQDVVAPTHSRKRT